MYELAFKDGMRLPILKLVRDVLDHYEVAPSQLIPNTWRILMALECLSLQHGFECEVGEVLYSYYLKEHNTKKGRYQLITRVSRVPIITCLRTNNHFWKDRFFFVRGNLMYGPRGSGDAPNH